MVAYIWFLAFAIVLCIVYLIVRTHRKRKFPKFKLDAVELTDLSISEMIKHQNHLYLQKGFSTKRDVVHTIHCPEDHVFVKQNGTVFEFLHPNGQLIMSTLPLGLIVEQCWNNHLYLVLLTKYNHKHQLRVYDYNKVLLFTTEPFNFGQGIWFLNHGFFCCGIFNKDYELRYYALDQEKGHLVQSFKTPTPLYILPILNKEEAICTNLVTHEKQLIDQKSTLRVLRILSDPNVHVFGIRNDNFYAYDDAMHQIIISNPVMIIKIHYIQPPHPKARLAQCVLFDKDKIAMLWHHTIDTISCFDESLETIVETIESRIHLNHAFVHVPVTTIKSHGYGFYYSSEDICVPPMVFRFEQVPRIAMEYPTEIQVEHSKFAINDVFQVSLITPRCFNVMEKHPIRVILSSKRHYNACRVMDWISQCKGLVVYMDISGCHLRNMTLYMQHYKALLQFVTGLACYSFSETTIYAEDLGASLVGMHLTSDFEQIALVDGLYAFENDLMLQSPMVRTTKVDGQVLVVGHGEMPLKYLLKLQKETEAYGYITQ